MYGERSTHHLGNERLRHDYVATRKYNEERVRGPEREAKLPPTTAYLRQFT